MTTIAHTPNPLNPAQGPSETSFALNFAVLILSACIVWTWYGVVSRNPVELYGVLLVSVLVLTVLLETFFHRETRFWTNLRIRRPLSLRRVLCREVALLVTFAVIALAYWLFPAFAERDMKRHFYPFLKTFVPVLLALSVPYFCLMDRVDPEEEDVLCRIGRALLTFRRTVTQFELGNYVRTWLVKAFWLTLMQPSMVEKIRVFMYYHWEKLAGSPLEIYLMASTICYAIDLVYASTGYVLNLRLFETHTRTAEPTLFGWLVGVACYWPFWGVLVYPYFLDYDRATVHWHDTLFAMGGVAWWIWAGIIVFCELIYALSSVSAGIRFSNLTYRGLWSTGPYRLTKHPAYVFKSVSWWFLSVPFLLNTGATALRCTILLIGLNILYYLRARTEERHLSHYPEYVAYALEMNERSIFRWCARILPFLKYRPPVEAKLLFKVKGDSK